MENVQPFSFRRQHGAISHWRITVTSSIRNCLRRHIENKGKSVSVRLPTAILAHLIKKETRYHDWPRIFSIIDAFEHAQRALSRS